VGRYRSGLICFEKDGYTALMLAAGKGHLEVVKALVQAGAEVKRQVSGAFS
jgi:ankyrin repeat protein